MTTDQPIMVRLKYISILMMEALKNHIQNALYYPTSPVNVISIGKLSWCYAEGNYDEDTHIKSTGSISWFLWDK